jgi:hypothetical protein
LGSPLLTLCFANGSGLLGKSNCRPWLYMSIN